MATTLNIQVDEVDEYEMMDADSKVRFEVTIKTENSDELQTAWNKLSQCGKFSIECLDLPQDSFMVQIRDGEVKSSYDARYPATTSKFDVLAEIANIIKG